MKLSTRLAAVSALLALAATPALVAPAAAQTPPAAPGAAPSPGPFGAAPSAAPGAPAVVVPAPVVPAPAPEVPPEKLALARQVVLGSGMGRSFEPMLSQLEEQIPRVVTRTRPDLSKDLTGVLAQLQPEFDKKSGDMIDIAARIYAAHMSDADLKATAAFFDSPAGNAYRDAQPVMLDELVVAMQAWTQQTSTYMMKRVQQEMEKKGDKF